MRGKLCWLLRDRRGMKEDRTRIIRKEVSGAMRKGKRSKTKKEK